MDVIMLRGSIMASLLMASTGVFAQAVDESALDALDRAVQPVPVIREPAGAVELRGAMRRIAAQPDDADALADAGNAALTLGDANAALNFYTRANAVRPRNGKITSGLAVATVRTENPFEALRLFDDAVRLGVSERSIAADRALAFDLLGNFARAQQDYQLARSASVSDDLIVRQAISLSLAGQKSDSDGMLLPLLKKNNGAAWRARAFMLAARGDFRESTKVAQGFMDARSAQKMERYLRLMPELTGAQQAAAMHLGHFPASNVGRDSEAVRRVAATIPLPASVKNESRLIPAGEPLGKKPDAKKPTKDSRKRERRRDREEAERAARLPEATIPSAPVKIASINKTQLLTDNARTTVENARVSTVEVTKSNALPPPETVRALVSVSLPSMQSASNVPSANVVTGGTVGTAIVAAAPMPVPVKSEPVVVAQPRPQSMPSSIPAIQGPSVTGAPLNAVPVNSGPPGSAQPQQSPTAAVVPRFDLAAIVGAIEIPESEQKPSAVPVDLKKLRPTLPKVAAADVTAKATKVDAKKPVTPAHPARFWVQVATGEAGALGFDYRRLAKKNADLFKNLEGWTSAWGRTSRLLVGPFADLKTSKKWEADFKKAGGDGFAWKSENGVAVTALKGK